MTEELDIEFINSFNEKNVNFKLFKTNNIIYLKSINHTDWLPFSISFLSNNINKRKNQLSLKQELMKAIGIKNNYRPKILDTTAGLGRDSFMLANIGCEITMIERNKVIYILLHNALHNAKLNSNTKEITSRMKLINNDAIQYLKNNNENFDVIYIDPMFPKSNKSRLVKKEMQIFRELIGDDLDSEELLKLALEQKVKRVVVKRMIKSKYLGNLKPNFEIKGNIIRFDVYENIL